MNNQTYPLASKICIKNMNTPESKTGTQAGAGRNAAPLTFGMSNFEAQTSKDKNHSDTQTTGGSSKLALVPGSAESPPWPKISQSSEGAYRELMRMHPVGMSQPDLRQVILIAVILGRQIEAELSSVPNDLDQTIRSP